MRELPIRDIVTRPFTVEDDEGNKVEVDVIEVEVTAVWTGKGKRVGASKIIKVTGLGCSVAFAVRHALEEMTHDVAGAIDKVASGDEQVDKPAAKWNRDALGWPHATGGRKGDGDG